MSQATTDRISAQHWHGYTSRIAPVKDSREHQKTREQENLHYSYQPDDEEEQFQIDEYV